MNVFVIGCGRVGAALANLLDRKGHDVAVMDIDEDAFKKLSDDFSGTTVLGSAMDMSVLTTAGIESCDAVAVVTQDDNNNITVSQLIREYFGIENVLARISDPLREKVFKEFGLKTSCPTKIAADTMYTTLTEPWDDKRVVIESATITFHTMGDIRRFTGKPVSKVRLAPEYSAFGIVRKNGTLELIRKDNDPIIEKGDNLILTHVTD